MNRFALIILGTLLLLTEFAVAMCLRTPLYLALIRVESCATIKGEQNLLVTGKLQGFIETDEREPKELSVTMIDDWKAQPAEAFVWMQSDQNARDCRYIEQLDPFVVTMKRPCCDTRPHWKHSCKERLREISEIRYTGGQSDG